jgi:hypothetical protein
VLLATNISAWTPAIPGVVRDSPIFERGFLVALHLHTAAGIRAAAEARACRTIEELWLDKGATSLEGLPALLARLPLLRVLWIDSAYVLTTIAEGPPLPSLRVLGGSIPWLPPPACPGLPRFAVLSVRMNWENRWDEGEFTELLDRAVSLGLHALVYKGPKLPFNDAIRAFRATQLPELRFALTASGWRIRVRRDSPRVDVARGPYPVKLSIKALLRSLDDRSLDDDRPHREFAVNLDGAGPTVEDEARSAVAAFEARGVRVRLDGAPIDLEEVPPG